MTHLPPDPPAAAAAAADFKPQAKHDSLLVAPRTPVTRWNRKYLLAGAAGLGLLVGAGFYFGFGAMAPTPARKAADPQANIDTSQPQKPAFGDKFAAGYADPSLKGGAPGLASLPAPDAGQPARVAGAQGAAPPPPDPAIQAAREQAVAARQSGPFFGSGQSQGQPGGAASGMPLLAGGPEVRSPVQDAAAEVQPGNGQLAKRQFAQTARADDYLANPLQPPLSPWEIKAGTIIPAALLTAIDSDLPGEVIAQVTEPVYDHVTGRTVLIPQGARLIGQYDSQVAYGQTRALVAWNRVIMPNGASINIGSMTGADVTGASGLHDKVDLHGWQLARGILLSTLFSVGASAAQDASARSSGELVLNSAGSGVANASQMVGQQITQRDLNRQPTLRVRAGFPIRVIVNKDMILAPYRSE